MCLGFVFFLQKCLKSFMLLSQSWLLISSGALPLERWWKFGTKAAVSVAVPWCVVTEHRAGPVAVTAGPSRGWARQGRGLPTALPRPWLKLRALLQGAIPGTAAKRTCSATAKVLNYLKSRRVCRVWIKEMGQTLWRQGWNIEGRTKLCCIISRFMNGVAERGKGAWLTWCDLKIHPMCYTQSHGCWSIFKG